jgi:hypothetical protein
MVVKDARVYEIMKYSVREKGKQNCSLGVEELLRGKKDASDAK